MAARRMGVPAMAVLAVSAVLVACGHDGDGAVTVVADDAGGSGDPVLTTAVVSDDLADVSEDGEEAVAVTDTTAMGVSDMETFPPPAPAVPFEVEPVDCSPWVAETAEAGICDSFSRWVRFDTPDEERVQMMEGGEARADAIISGFTEFRASTEFAAVRVHRVTLLTDALAEVEFEVRWMDGRSPYFPDPIVGYAVYEAPRWRVSAFTTCAMALSFGTDCSGLQLPAPPGEEPLG